MSFGDPNSILEFIFGSNEYTTVVREFYKFSSPRRGADSSSQTTEAFINEKIIAPYGFSRIEAAFIFSLLKRNYITSSYSDEVDVDLLEDLVLKRMASSNKLLRELARNQNSIRRGLHRTRRRETIRGRDGKPLTGPNSSLNVLGQFRMYDEVGNEVLYSKNDVVYYEGNTYVATENVSGWVPESQHPMNKWKPVDLPDKTIDGEEF